MHEEETENVVASIASMVKNVFKNIMPQPLVVMAAGEHYAEMDVTWKEVDNKTFTSNGGETFTYEAILPNEYNGATLVLGDVSIPQINVSIEANTNKTDMKLSFDKSEVTMFAGGASPENNLNGVMENAVVAYSSSNPSIANVDSSGTVTATGKGDVTITATAGETANYNSASVSYTIHVMDPKEGYRVTATGWSNETFGVVAASGDYRIRRTPDGMNGSGISYGADDGITESGVAEFYVYHRPTNSLSGKLTEEYYVDKEAPTGTIVVGNKTWDTVQTDNSQDIYTVEKPIEVTINAADNGSGIKSVEYYTLGTMHWGRNQLELMATVSGGWKTYSEDAKPVLNARGGEAREYVYVKITDNVGNVTYLSSGPIKVLGDATTNTPTTTPEEETNTPVSEIKIDSVNVKSVSTNKAKVQVTASGNGTINEYYLFWTQTEGTYDAEAVKANGVMQAKGDFSISGLSPDTKYYVYAFAKDTDGNETAVSAASFTTDAKKAGHSSSGSSSGSEDSAADSTPAAASADPGAAAVTAVTPVSTGDTQHIMPYMLMGASALAGLAVITLYFKKSKEK